MNFDKIPESKIFNNNPKEEIISWMKQLKYFHLLKARQGHNCEGDKWAIYLNYSDETDLATKLSQLNITLQPLGDNEIAFDPFEDISIDNLDKIRYVIPDLPHLIQPQDQMWNGIAVHIWVQNKMIEISISGNDKLNSYMVSSIDFEHCKELEKLLEDKHWQTVLNNDVEKLSNCISSSKYPELFL